MFGPKYGDLETVVDLGLEGTVQTILSATEMPNPPGEWVNEPAPAWDALTPEEIDAIIEQYYMWMFELAILWYDRMAANNITIREMMTLFWHNHFAVEVDKVFSLTPCFIRSSPPFLLLIIHKFNCLTSNLSMKKSY